MKFTLVLFIFLSSFSFGQDEVVCEFGNVKFMEAVPGVGTNRVKRMATTVNNYIASIVNNEYDDWYASFSDSTIARVAPHKFKNKFKRLQEYGLHSDSIIVVSVAQTRNPFANESGREYVLVLDLGHDLNVANRVSFDQLKRTDDNANKRYIAINAVAIDKGFEICIHKYGSDKANTNNQN